MFEKLVGGIFGAGDVPWDLVGYGAMVGVAVILIDRLVLEPRDARFRMHPMPLAVGLYLPWTVTTPILLGGLVHRFVAGRSRARGDSVEVRQQVIHRGLLFSSGLVAGKAIMGILIAVLVITNLDMSLLATWSAGGLWLDAFSLLGFVAIMWLLVKKAMGRGSEA